MIVVLAARGAGFGAAATDGTPASRESVGHACPVLPRSFGEILRLLEAPLVTPSAQVPMRDGVRATPEVQAEIELLLGAFLGCSGAGEPVRVWALYSDAYLARLLSRERGYDRNRYDADLVPRPLQTEDHPSLRSISTVEAFGGTRAVARIVVWYPNLGREKTLDCRFVLDAGDWLIDEIDGEITFSLP